ncbi:LanC-like protein 1 [Armadillidium nasatum]|uniref:LanC-like protein 1 n=1 Tax=Armadillidium nasatum TaxID=96803 RepID=A0A5N5THA2_9CRUS|nr:LanC-like protein 1 [Armadillidium nasatum]
MSDDRYFKNPFPNYKPEIAAEFIDFETKELKPEVRSSIRNSTLKLIQYLERKLEEEIDWKDTSVYTGTSGYTLLYLHLAECFNDERYLQKAYSLAEKSLKCLKGRRISFLCGDSGPLALGAVIYEKLGLSADVQFCVSNLVKLKNEVLELGSSLPDELLYGRVGYLYALLFVKQKVTSELIDTDLIRSVLLVILESGKYLSKRKKVTVPLSYEWHDKNYFGAAHGVSGILTLLLQVHERLTTSEVNDLIRPTVDRLATYIFPSGNLPSSEGSTSDKLVHWCHGAPGAIFLFSYAYKVFKDPKYLNYAKGCADVIWLRGLLKKGYGLCHGTAGNGSALLFFYQVTGDIKYLYMASQFARWCQDYGKHNCRTPDRPLSMFEGLAGTIYFLTDMEKPMRAKFPAFIL